MRIVNILLLLTVMLISTNNVFSQITEREKPAEWSQLIEGGRYMDRFLPMHDGQIGKDVWGAEAVKGRFIDNGTEDPEYSFWGGNILKGKDGKWHIFVAGWPEKSPNGHMFWGNSTVYHAVSDNSYGPFKVLNSVGKGHNPEAYILSDGRIVVYVIDGYYIADDINSLVWTYGVFNFDPRGRKIIEGLTNLSFAKRQDGSRLMVCRGGGIWISRDGLSTYEQITSKRVYPDVKGNFEDPVIWKDSLQYHLIVNDWLGRIAFYERSYDGLHWIVEQGEAYEPGIAVHKDGYKEDWFKYERAKVVQDDLGRVIQMNFAVIDTIKWEDKPGDRHSSKNLCIPMNPGLQIEVMNTEPITEKTKTIDLLIKAEENFDPEKDLDINSLVFGSYNEVNFGRGAKVKKYRKMGSNIIVTFDGKGSGITPDEWAPKMIGHLKNGNMVYGYARLPYFDYTTSMVSPGKPIIDTTEHKISFNVKNYGLKESAVLKLNVENDGKRLYSSEIKSLKPYEECKVEFPYTETEVITEMTVKIGDNTDSFKIKNK